MDLYQKQQFGFFLQTAVERYVVRLEERFRGAEGALAAIQSAPEGEGVWLSQFTQALFDDFLIDNVEGACFVLQSLASRPSPAAPAGPIGATLIQMAKAAFAELLLQKTIESLEQHASYQPV